MCEQINGPRARSISLKVCRSWFSVCPWTSWFCQKFLATRTSISRFICFVSNNYSSFCWYLWIRKFSKCGNGLILFKFLTTSTPCHGCEMLGIPSSHALIWDYDMQDHLPLQFQLCIDTADEPPNQIGYCNIVCSAASDFIMWYPWAVWSNKTIELEIPDHPGDHLRRLDAWLQHEKLKVTGYAAPLLEYLAYVPWKKMHLVSLALHLTRCPRPERTKQHKQLNVIHRVLDLSAFHEGGNAWNE